MRKISSDMENPIDNIMVAIAEKVSPFFKELNFTPNMLTTVSNILCGFSIYYIYKNKFKLGAILYLVSYFFDCFDGYFARKYNMTSKFGDKYDHISDTIKFIGILYILYKKIPSDKFKIFMLIGSILLILSASHLGCQEKIYDNSEHGDMLELTELLCITDPEKQIKFTRYFGCGTLIMFVVVFIFFL